MSDRTDVRLKVDMRPVLQLAVLADYIIPFAIRVIADLGIADLLEHGPRPVAELAKETGTHAQSLHRTMRALVSRDIFAEPEPGVFSLRPMGEVLASSHPFSLKDGYPLLSGDVAAWAKFDHSLRTGKPAFDQVHGEDYWTYLANRPEERSRFNKAMACYSRIELRAVLTLYDWTSFDVLVDIGGGNGRFISGLLSHIPNLRGVLYDLPQVVTDAPPVLEEAGVSDRCEIRGGSALASVPEGYSGYVMKRVLYDFDDEGALTILKNIRDAMRPDSRLLVIDPIAERAGGYEYGLSVDLLMLAMVTGYTRTREEFEHLLAKADLELVRLITTPNFPIAEVMRKGVGRHQ